MLIFYDTETTGTNITFDQILQFAAILTDDSLNEIDRFEVRCRLLPWIAPSPSALLVTSTPPQQLEEPSLPSLFDMMSSVRNRCLTWGAGTFVGFNSMKFDERLLQRALWQTLNYPFITVSNGNSRFDLITVVRAVTHFYPGTLALPQREDGRPSFKLDRLASLNGFDQHAAHDALGDVEATIFLAHLVAERHPTFWRTLLARAPKDRTVAALTFGNPILVFEYFNGRPRTWFGQRIDQDGIRASHATVVDLGSELIAKDDTFTRSSAPLKHSPFRRIPLNKAPCIFTLDEASLLWNITFSSQEKARSEFLAAHHEYCARLCTDLGHPISPTGDQLEERVFDNFPSNFDRNLIERFQAGSWTERARIAGLFQDPKLCHLALRLVYISARHLLPQNDSNRIQAGIRMRLLADDTQPHSWRSLADATEELSILEGETPSNPMLLAEIKSWLTLRVAAIQLDVPTEV